MSARRNTNNRHYWPRSTAVYAPMIILASETHDVASLTTAAATARAATGTAVAISPAITTLIVSRTAVRAIQ